jgi:hypothetical protein
VEEVMNTIAVISAALEGDILENGTQPKGTCAELLDVRQLILDAG